MVGTRAALPAAYGHPERTEPTMIMDDGDKGRALFGCLYAGFAGERTVGRGCPRAPLRVQSRVHAWARGEATCRREREPRQACPHGRGAAVSQGSNKGSLTQTHTCPFFDVARESAATCREMRAWAGGRAWRGRAGCGPILVVSQSIVFYKRVCRKQPRGGKRSTESTAKSRRW